MKNLKVVRVRPSFTTYIQCHMEEWRMIAVMMEMSGRPIHAVVYGHSDDPTTPLRQCPAVDAFHIDDDGEGTTIITLGRPKADSRVPEWLRDLWGSYLCMVERDWQIEDEDPQTLVDPQLEVRFVYQPDEGEEVGA